MAKKINNKSAIRKDSDKKVSRLNRAIYSATDPTYGYPTGLGIPAVGGRAGVALFNPDDMWYEVTDSVADAAWRKRLGLSYDDKFLIENENGSFRLPKDVEMEIPTDTTALKRRIQANKKLADSPEIMGDDWKLVNGMIKEDEKTLDALRRTYKTGEPVVINEYSHNSRKLAKDGKIVEEADNYKSPLNVLQNYTIQYDPKTNTMRYRDTYDFNEFESFVLGESFDIEGEIPLNKYSFGSWLKNTTGKFNTWNTGVTDKFLKNDFGQGLSNLGIKSGNIGGIANTAATAIGGLLAGNNTTGVGKALQGIGSLASNIPGVGGLIGAGVNLVGGLVNAAFGSNINKEFVNQTEAQARQQSNYVSGASDNAALLSDWGSLSFLGDINKSDVGSDGWFSNKAGRETDRLNTLVDEANMRALASLSNTAENIDKQNDLMLMANYRAYGGPIDMKYTGVMSPFGNKFKDGGIFIKPSKRGTFTAAAKKRGMGVQEFASKVLANKEDYSPAMVKKANFARNASKWHDDGGPLYYPKTNEKGQVVLNPDNPQDIKWLREQQGKRGARAVNKSKREVVPLIGTVLGLPLAGTLGTTIGLGGISAIGDAASIIMNPSDPLNYIGMPWTKMAKQADKILNVSKTIDSAVDNSKIVNIPVYHGSNKVFDDFNYASSQNIGVHAGTRKAANDRLNAIGAKEEANIREGILTMNENNIIPIKDIQNFDVYNISQLYDNNMLFKQSLKKAGIKDNIFKQYITPMADDYQTLLDNKKLVDDLAERGIMFKYINKGEDIGSTSYLITNPNRVTWSKNRIKKFGGELFTNGVTTIGNGGTHESNPYEGVQMGVDPQGIPNLVEEGEVVFNDYVFSNRLIVPDAVREKYKLRDNKELTFADAAKQMQKESEERPNDPISKRGLNAAMAMLQQEQETVRMEKESNKYAKGGKLGKLYAGTGPYDNYLDLGDYDDNIVGYTKRGVLMDNGDIVPFDAPEVVGSRATTGNTTSGNGSTTKASNSNWLRYAPIAGHAIGAFSDLFSSPDYSAADTIEAVDITPATVGYTPVGNYLSYKPFDRDYYLNKLNADVASTRRAITNTSGGNRAAAMAGLLAADYNYGNQLGALARQAEEYNQALRERVEGFNRQTNLANAEMGLKAAMANAESRNQATKLRLSQAGQVAAMRKAAKDAYDARRSNNINVLLEELGGLGTENWNRDWLDRLAKAGVLKIDSKGNPVISSAKGGKIRTKKKKGFTYG